MSIRVATEADIPVLVKLVQTGLAKDYVWKYCFPTSNSHESEVLIEKTLRQFMRPDKKEWLICVNQELDNHEIVAMALWHLPVGDGAGFAELATVPSTANDDHTANILASPRIAALQAAEAKAQETVRNKYGQHMFLHAVITNPEWKGLGYAKHLARHGMELACNKNVALVALVSPDGYIFYSGLGFRDFGRSTVKVEGEHEEIDLKTMVYNPSHTKDPSAVGWVEWFLGHGQHHHAASLEDPKQQPSWLETLGLGHQHGTGEGRRPSHG